MATVLRRPMFKIGGSADGTGITSGLRRYGFANPSIQGDYDIWGNKILEEGKGGNVEEITSEGFTWDSGDNGLNERVDAAREAILNPEKPKYGFKELIADAYRTARDAPTGKDWLMNAADLALERSDEAKVKAEAKKLSDLELLEKMQTGKWGRRDRAFDEWSLEKQMNQKERELGQSDERLTLEKLKADRDYEVSKLNAERPTNIQEKRQAQKEADQLLAEYGSIEKLMDAGKFGMWDHLMGLGNDYWKPQSALRFDIFKMMVGEKDIVQGIETSKWPQETEEERRAFNKELERRVRMYYGSLISRSNEALGGRPGYNMGMGPVMDQQTDMSMTENIDTPQGDMSMTENIDIDQMGQQMGMPAQTMPSDDPFVLLRSRLPEEITDDVVRLIAYNPDAFADFADIETQDDVIAFNKKWGVELVINTDEMSGAIA